MQYANVRIFGLIAVVLLLGGYLLMRGDEDVTNYPPKDGPIIAFGDSLIRGVGSPETEGFIKPLSVLVGEPIINMGVPGDTTADGLARLEVALQKEPRIVILLLGGNDRLKQLPTTETFANLRLLIGRIQASGSIVMLLGVRGNLLTDRFSKEFEGIAEETGSAYVPDVLDGIYGDTSLMSDGVHPNKEGYARIAKKVYPVLEGVVR